MDYSLFTKQLDSLMTVYRDMQGRSQYNDLSDIPKADRQNLITRSLAAIDRIAGSDSTYGTEARRLMKQSPALHEHTSSVLGVVHALLDDLNAGYLERFTEIVHAQMFSDFLDMAQHLNGSGYKDAAAVIVGAALESHLRELATKNSIPTIDSNGRPLKADKMNADLAKAALYAILDQKSITAHLDLRNKAAHGKYTEYTKEQVDNLITSITEFIKRMPA